MRRALLGLVIGLGLAGPVAAADEVIARVGGVDMTATEVRALLDGLSPQQREALAKDPAALGRLLRQMLAGRLLLAEAEAKKWDKRPEVAAAIERARQSVIVESYLQTKAVAPDGYPSEADIASAYDANRTSFLVPRQYRLAQIFIALPKGADKAAEAAAQKKLAAVQAALKPKGADFLALAKQFSDEEGAGADPAFAAETAIRPEIRERIAGLDEGAVTDPIRLDDGWHLVKLFATKAAYTRPLDEVRPQLVEALRRERAQVEAQNYMAGLLQANPAAINEIALTRLLAGEGQ
ncbi:peptidylprolyl isomerase [Zavarzinia aquatilis]|uniref:Parvulin-like PPIase n=1 Tax=Zavarzinia aquatilis TaxID=2211142 RepID=A0A317ECL4_9PROT|nr:peptidylprolyl isomerase [Zavarzinia aquatilis]PWR24649.1 peptidylprolyl isomerase [Zavarzinia aquatilis]